MFVYIYSVTLITFIDLPRMRCGIGLLVAVVISQSIDEQINVHFAQSGHTNNWAVLVCASRYWYNYRHIANTLSVYRSVKRLGIPGWFVYLRYPVRIYV